MATQIAQAYVQVVPTTKGIKNQLSEEFSSSGSSAGDVFGSQLVSKLKGIIAAAGIGTFLKEALDAGGALQQSFGGLDTIYEEAGEAAKNYAKEAVSAGISMNDYAEQAVSFGAALKSAFGGDVTKAAEAANTAIMDMADNSAKMGTDITAVQNAYQGFAKQNYTMLDNLKLGYGGTKTEMERLLADAEELSGVHYDIDNLGDVYSAIHVIQGELGLTGVAANEASTTFTGSFGAMKAAATNLLAELTTGGDVQGALTTLVETTGTFLFNNLLPMIGNIITAIPGLVSTLITEGIPTFMESGMTMLSSMGTGILNNIPTIIADAEKTVKSFLDSITAKLPTILSQGVTIISNLATGILNNLPAVITNIGKIMNDLMDFLYQNYPVILKKGFELIANLAKGILDNLPEIISSITNVMANLLKTILSHFPEILQTGIELLGKLAAGIIKAIPQLIASLPKVFTAITKAFKGVDWGSLGHNIMEGIKNGIINAISSVIQAAKEAASSIYDTVKDFFDIGSPSKLMANDIGKWIPAGIAVGIEGNMKDAEDAMDALSSKTVSIADYNFGKMSMDDTAIAAASGTTINQVINVNSKTQSPDELARAIRVESKYGLMVGGALG